jgi:hypothetical protein
MADTYTVLDLPIGLDPNTAWTFRWMFAADMNRDGQITISDFWLWVKWIFFAPGDGILFGIMFHLPSFAKFFEISTSMLYGGWSFALSLWVWYFVIVGSISSIHDAIVGK